jgi:hypothetical protein
MLPAEIGHMAGCRLVIMSVGSGVALEAGRVGHSDSQLPSTGSISSPEAHYHLQLGEWGFVRWTEPLE